jgi:hypothetical protein
MKAVSHYTEAILGLVVLFLIVAALYPILSTALENLTAAGIPLGSVLSVIIPLLLGIGLLYVGYRVFLPKSGGLGK